MAHLRIIILPPWPTCISSYYHHVIIMAHMHIIILSTWPTCISTTFYCTPAYHDIMTHPIWISSFCFQYDILTHLKVIISWLITHEKGVAHGNHHLYFQIMVLEWLSYSHWLRMNQPKNITAITWRWRRKKLTGIRPPSSFSLSHLTELVRKIPMILSWFGARLFHLVFCPKEYFPSVLRLLPPCSRNTAL